MYNCSLFQGRSAADDSPTYCSCHALHRRVCHRAPPASDTTTSMSARPRSSIRKWYFVPPHPCPRIGACLSLTLSVWQPRSSKSEPTLTPCRARMQALSIHTKNNLSIYKKFLSEDAAYEPPGPPPRGISMQAVIFLTNSTLFLLLAVYLSPLTATFLYCFTSTTLPTVRKDR